MTKEQLFHAHLKQIWLNSGALLKTLLVAIPVGIVVLAILWGIIKLIEKKAPQESSAAAIIRERKGWILGFGFYISLIIQIVIFSRPFGSTRIVNWIPFRVPGGENLIVLYSLANAIIFIPFGVLVPKVFRRVNTVWKMALVTFITSVCIEIIQYILSCGYTEVEDVIMNVIGGIVGYLIASKLIKKHKEKS